MKLFIPHDKDQKALKVIRVLIIIITITRRVKYIGMI